MKIYIFLRFAILFILITEASNCFAQICLSGWQYFTPITITNNVSSTLTNYDVKVTINTYALLNSAHMLSNTGDDIRFIDPSTCTNLSYWIESGINTTNTVIWVKIPSLSGSSTKTINMYYGNGSAKPVSNGDSTFLLFDDFNGSSVNSSKWDSYSSYSTFSMSSSKLTISTGSGSTAGTAILVSSSSFASPITAEAMVTSTNGFWSSLAILNSGTWVGYFMYCGDASSGANEGMHLGEAYSAGGTYAGHFKTNNSSPGTETGLWQMFWPATGSQLLVWPGGSTSSSQTNVSLASSVQLAFGNVYASIGSTTYDWVRARAYASTEPSTSNGSEVANYYTQVSYIIGSPFCTNSAADSFYISFITGISASYNSNNVFTAQLSDSSGSFVSPTNIGSLASTNAGNILVKIPAGTYGFHFRIRIINSTNAAYNSAPSASVLEFVPHSKPGFSINSVNQCLKGNDFVFNNTTTGSGTLTYRWNFGDGNTNKTTSPIYTYSNSGSYTVTLTSINTAGCTDSISKPLKVYNATSLFSVNNPTQCYTGNSFSFTNKSYGYNNLEYKWDFGDGNISASANPTYSYTAAGDYTVKLFVTADSICTDTSSTNIIVNPKVFSGFSINNLSACLNQQNFIFTNSSSVSSGSLDYKWNFGDGNSSTNTSPGYKYKQAGTYQVKLLATAGSGCFDTISKFVSVFTLPMATAKALGLTTICDGGQVIINTNTVTGYKYQWLDNGSKIISAGANATYVATNSGSYKVVVSNSNACSDTSLPVLVTVNALPPAPVISQVKRKLKSNSVEVTYQWYLNGVLISGADSMNYSPSVLQGSFTVTVTDTNGCSNTSTVYSYDVTGIDVPVSNNNILIYPNPAHDYIDIDLSSNSEDIRYLQIIDMHGRCVKSFEHLGTNRTIKVLTGDIVKGMYFIRLTGKENTFVQKIIVE